MAQGPLAGLRVVEFAGIGPGPFCGMLLSDLGADVIRIDRKAGYSGPGPGDDPRAVTNRGRRSLACDLKNPASIELCLDLIERADALFEGFRPGVMERLGLGPDVALARNPRLVYGRLTGWGQDGPYALRAGHDINYIAISGALDSIGTPDAPVAPLNLVGDFGGGALYMAMGLLAGVLHARNTGTGQVVDCAISDAAASLMAMFYGYAAMGRHSGSRGGNLLDGGAHFYNSYRCADGKWISVGPIEPQFYALLREHAALADEVFEVQFDQSRWEEAKVRLAEIFATRTRQEWCAILEPYDTCFAPIMSIAEAPDHPHNHARELFVEVEGVRQPGAVPRFSHSPGAVQGRPPRAGEHNEAVLADWGIAPEKIAALTTPGGL